MEIVEIKSHMLEIKKRILIKIAILEEHSTNDNLIEYNKGIIAGIDNELMAINLQYSNNEAIDGLNKVINIITYKYIPFNTCKDMHFNNGTRYIYKYILNLRTQ